jgi:hypothetical protein
VDTRRATEGPAQKEIAITLTAAESLEILLMGMDLKPGDEVMTTTQDYPRMPTTLRQRKHREGIPLGQYLMDKHKIFAVPIIHPEFKGLRITPKSYTTLPELDRFCEIMTMVAKTGLPAG